MVRAYWPFMYHPTASCLFMNSHEYLLLVHLCNLLCIRLLEM